MASDTDSILNNLREQRELINRAIAILGGQSTGKRQGRPRGSKLSAAARKKISAGMKKRWAARKKTS